MSRLEIILSAALFVSLIFNIGVTIYARAAIVRLLSISEELGDLQEMINAFTKHIGDLYSLEIFYGDETLAAILEHAMSFNEHMETFEYIYALTEPEREENPEEQEEELIDDDPTT